MDMLLLRSFSPCMGLFSSRQRGFTLIELLFTIAITGVLSSVAYPSLLNVVQKVRRTDALVAVMQVQMAQERHRSNHLAYGSLADIGQPETTTSSHYTLEVANASSAGYELMAVATGAQARDSDCRYLKLTVDGLNVVRTSGSDATVANTAALNRRCWSQ
jgi:type IV pilus assembly protein PilE